MTELKEERIVYLCIHKRLWEKFGMKLVDKNEVRVMISRLYHIPRNLQRCLIKELIQMGILVEASSKFVSVSKLKFDPVARCAILYRRFR